MYPLFSQFDVFPVQKKRFSSAPVCLLYRIKDFFVQASLKNFHFFGRGSLVLWLNAKVCEGMRINPRYYPKWQLFSHRASSMNTIKFLFLNVTAESNHHVIKPF